MSEGIGRVPNTFEIPTESLGQRLAFLVEQSATSDSVKSFPTPFSTRRDADTRLTANFHRDRGSMHFPPRLIRIYS